MRDFLRTSDYGLPGPMLPINHTCPECQPLCYSVLPICLECVLTKDKLPLAFFGGDVVRLFGVDIGVSAYRDPCHPTLMFCHLM